VTPEEIVVGPGAKPGLFFTSLALVNPGDEVMYPDPGFPTYKAMIQVAGGIPVPIPLRPDGSSFDMVAFHDKISAKTKMVVLNSPSNPTGGVMPIDDLKKIALAAVANDAFVLSDEIYSGLVYGESKMASVWCSNAA
jgi:aspartate/methionine/tyrosine aminotransferase